MKHFIELLFMTLIINPILLSDEPCMIVGSSPSSQQYLNSTVTLKILLVEFSDVKHRTSPSAYKKSDFVNLLVSSGVYVSTNKYSPDGDQVFGSLGDYFNKMSSGNLTLTGNVINTEEIPDRPEWISLPNTKAYYHSNSISNFMTTSVSEAANQGVTVGSLGAYTKLVIIYAGNTYFGPSGGYGLNPAANDIGATIYTMSERAERPYNQEHSSAKFAHIGPHCHEFAHLLGVGHSSGSRADIMEAGRRNGPDNYGAAPAPLNPAHRALLGWISPNTNVGPRDIYYNLTNPVVYKINGNYGTEYFIIENRRFNQTMTIGSTTVSDYNSSDFFPSAWSHGTISQGIFVWRITGSLSSIDYDNCGLIYASGRYGRTFPENTLSETDDGVPFPGIAGIKVLSPWSDSRNPHSTSYDPDIGIFNNLFVPNTKSSTNVGMEILSENSGQGYFTAMLYQSSPQDASPSKPQNTAISVYTGGGEWNPKITWSAMAEPDVTTGGSIYVERSKKLATGIWTAWSTIATLAGTATQYIDLTFSQSGSGNDSLKYRIRAKDSQNQYSIYSDEVRINYMQYAQKRGFVDKTPTDYVLLQNYPNPFNPSTMIKYEIPEDENVVVKVFNLLGKEVATLVNGFKPAGYYEVNFDAGLLSSGIYIYRLTAGKYSETRKMTLMK